MKSLSASKIWKYESGNDVKWIDMGQRVGELPRLGSPMAAFAWLLSGATLIML